MKKATILMTALLMVSLWATVSLAAGSETDWNLELTFSAEGTSDLLPVTVGVAADPVELLKPPHLPGAVDTGNTANAYVRASVIAAPTRDAAKSVLDKDDATTQKAVWAVDVEAEKADATVTVTIDTSNYVSKYLPIAILVPGSGGTDARVEFITSDKIVNNKAENIQLFKSSGQKKRIYLVTSSSRTFAASIGSESKVVGLVELPGKVFSSGTNVKLFSGSLSACGSLSKTADTVTDGIFEISDVPSGSYVVQIAKAYHLGTECEIAAGDATAACGALYAGDWGSKDTPDGKINLQDLSALKKAFNKSNTYDKWGDISFIDTNSDGKINLTELSRLKEGFNRKQDLKCGN